MDRHIVWPIDAALIDPSRGWSSSLPEQALSVLISPAAFEVRWCMAFRSDQWSPVGISDWFLAQFYWSAPAGRSQYRSWRKRLATQKAINSQQPKTDIKRFCKKTKMNTSVKIYDFCAKLLRSCSWSVTKASIDLFFKAWISSKHIQIANLTFYIKNFIPQLLISVFIDEEISLCAAQDCKRSSKINQNSWHISKYSSNKSHRVMKNQGSWSQCKMENEIRGKLRYFSKMKPRINWVRLCILMEFIPIKISLWKFQSSTLVLSLGFHRA